MNATTNDSIASVAEERAAVQAIDGRLGRAFVATLVVGGYMALGFAFGLGADAYLLLGIPIMIAFQVFIVRRPLRALWLRQVPPLTLTLRSALAVALIAIAPAIVAARGVGEGDPALIGWGLTGVVGAVGAVYTLRAMDRDAVRATIRATTGSAAILVFIMVVFRLATGGFDGNVAGALAAIVIGVATYLPVVFVMEEVFFRGLLDPYLQGPGAGADPGRATALYGSALWGIWHLPVASVSLGLATIPYLIVAHTLIGWFLVTSWRKTGNLAAPGIAHAVSDALRNAVAVF